MLSERSGALAVDDADPPTELVENVHLAQLGNRPGEETALVTLYPQPGCPIVRAMVVTSRPGLSVHFEAASDGTLLVRIR